MSYMWKRTPRKRGRSTPYETSGSWPLFVSEATCPDQSQRPEFSARNAFGSSESLFTTISTFVVDKAGIEPTLPRTQMTSDRSTTLLRRRGAHAVGGGLTWLVHTSD